MRKFAEVEMSLSQMFAYVWYLCAGYLGIYVRK
jgi:hypothetical protein